MLSNYLQIILFTVLTIGGLSVCFSWIFARLYCRPKRRLPTKSPADYGLPFEAVAFQSQGVTLRGWFIPAKENAISAPAIVVAHGWSSNAGQVLPVAKLLHEADFAVLLYNARGHGSSGGDGPITILKFAGDLLSAVDYVAGRSDVDASRIAAVGHSLGAAATIVAASVEPRIRLVVSSAAFADPQTLTLDFMHTLHIPRWPFLWLVSRFFERWLGTSMADVAPWNRIRQVKAPMLLIHGDSDPLIPPANMEILIASARREQVRGWLVPGCGHSDIIRDTRYAQGVVEFLKQHLSMQQSHCRMLKCG